MAGYMLLGAIIESVTKLTFSEVVEQNILIPLGMTNTCYLDHHKLVPGIASAYVREGDDIVHRAHVNFVHGNGASGLVSTVQDLLIWESALYTTKPLSREYLDTYLAPHVTKYAPSYYGYGWYLSDITLNDQPRRIHFHSGGGSGFIIRNEADEQTIIMLNNIPSDSLYHIGIELLSEINEKD